MDALQFAYWLNGFAELHGETPPTADQWTSIREHLGLVFNKITTPAQLPSPLRDWIPLPPNTGTPWWDRQPNCATPRLDQVTRVECKVEPLHGDGTV